jgi:UDP-N-acetylmuramate--alanine ligase
VHIGHSAANIAGAEVVVYTTAIRDTNPELSAARAAGLQIVHRAEVLAYMTAGKHGIAVTGTHGKSTTTAMLATILTGLGLDPTVFVGADAPNIGANGHSTNFRLGDGGAVIFEACESDGSFLQYEGCSQILLNLEAEHLDQHHDLEGVREAFRRFVAIADPQGFIVWCGDCPELSRVVGAAPCRTVSYGLAGAVDVTAREIELREHTISFVPVYRGVSRRRVTVPVPGKHNVRNSLAALAAAVESGIDADEAGEALGAYRSIGRRFDILGEFAGRLIVNDYAHHPTEISATLAAARGYLDRRIVVAFQPHLYSRTKFFMHDFAEALAAADVVILTDIYAAREDPIPGVSSEEIVEIIRREHPDKDALYIAKLADVAPYLRKHSRPGDMILAMGAGDVDSVAEELAASLGG